MFQLICDFIKASQFITVNASNFKIICKTSEEMIIYLNCLSWFAQLGNICPHFFPINSHIQRVCSYVHAISKLVFIVEEKRIICLFAVYGSLTEVRWRLIGGFAIAPRVTSIIQTNQLVRVWNHFRGQSGLSKFHGRNEKEWVYQETTTPMLVLHALLVSILSFNNRSSSQSAIESHHKLES